MNAAAEHTKGGEPWLRELTGTRHTAILARLTALAEQAAYPDPRPSPGRSSSSSTAPSPPSWSPAIPPSWTSPSWTSPNEP